ncbi:hypothetical protein F4776DRAFT_602759 [Hypoxylon sp. NC0597]|nr:hypothetical protein F4776DRAFT_602759 [Hypoxylon sp. NC0597]
MSADDLSLDNLTLSNMPSPALENPQASSDTRSSLLSLPPELRIEIYRQCISEIFGVFHFEDGLEDDIYPGASWTKPMAILRVCKQLHQEVAPMIYKRVKIYRSIDGWIKFFNKIGPRHGALIQDLTIIYRCGEKNFRKWYECHGLKCSLGENDRYEELFESMANANVKPQCLRIDITPCGGYSLVAGKQTVFGYSTCQVYMDLKFLGLLSRCFGNLQRIHLEGNFDTLWAFALRRRLGFILKCNYRLPYEDEILRTMHVGKWILINPNFLNPATDLDGYTPSKSVSGVYTKIKVD